MSCGTCHTKFSLFVKENGCASCGYSYCSNCLKYKHNLPAGPRKVCCRCHNKLTQPKSQEKKRDLKDKSDLKSSYSTNSINQKSPEKCYNTSEEACSKNISLCSPNSTQVQSEENDKVVQEIAKRLENLKADKNVKTPTEDELRERLNNLKDCNVDKPKEYSITQPIKKVTEQEEADNLLLQCLDKVALPKYDPDAEIQDRLNKLMGMSTTSIKQPNLEDKYENDDEEEQVSKIVQKALAEAAIELRHEKYYPQDNTGQSVQTGDSSHSIPHCNGCKGDFRCMDCFMKVTGEDSLDDDDEDACVMCDQTDDLVICTGCHGDTYCQICFVENHERFEMHKAIPKRKLQSKT